MIDRQAEVEEEVLYEKAESRAFEGHKVEIKGRLEEGRPEQAGQPDTKRSSHEQAPRLRLEAIKMISSNCSR